jgi:hypothetical protein
MALVTRWIADALRETPLYATLDMRPDVRQAFPTGAAAASFARHMDTAFVNIYNQPSGYFQLRCFASTCGELRKLCFLEEATAYRAMPAGRLRAEAAARLLRCWRVQDVFGAGEMEVCISVQGMRAGGAAAASGQGSSSSSAGQPPPAPQQRVGAATPSPPEGASLQAPRPMAARGGRDVVSWDACAGVRSTRLLNGVATLLLEAYAEAGVVLAPPRVLWAEACTALAASGALEHLQPHLLDDLLVAAMNFVAHTLFPAFLASPAFLAYTGMCYVAFQRPPLTKEDFSWIKPLGRGGYGMVYAVQRVDTGKLYAIKRMDKRLIKARHATRMIVNERDVLASVDHPFITGLQAAFHDQEEVFFVMDLLTGGDLEYYLLHAHKRFKEEEARFLAAEIFLGVRVSAQGKRGGGQPARSGSLHRTLTHPTQHSPLTPPHHPVPARARRHAQGPQARQHPHGPRGPRGHQ